MRKDFGGRRLGMSSSRWRWRCPGTLSGFTISIINWASTIARNRMVRSWPVLTAGEWIISLPATASEVST